MPDQRETRDAPLICVMLAAMPSHVMLVLWMVASDVASPTTAGLSSAVRDALGADTAVRVQALPRADAPRPDGPPPAGASIARVTWSDPEHRIAHLACYLPRSRRWITRDVTFSAQDPALERGRTLGFMVASMLLESREAAPSPRVTRVVASPSVEPPAPRELAVSAAVSGAASGNVTGLGPWVGAEYSLLPRLSVGAAADVRLGSIPAAQATTWTVSLGATSSFGLYRPTSTTWLGVRATVGGTRIAVTRLSEDDPEPEAQARWAPLLGLAGRAAFGFANNAGLFAELGVDTMLTRRTVPIEDTRPATFPALFPVARLGVSANF
jgi:hypothetical protein